MKEDPSYTRSGTNSHQQSGHHCTCTQAELHTHAYSSVYPWTLMRGSYHHMMHHMMPSPWAAARVKPHLSPASVSPSPSHTSHLPQTGYVFHTSHCTFAHVSSAYSNPLVFSDLLQQLLSLPPQHGARESVSTRVFLSLISCPGAPEPCLSSLPLDPKISA